MTAPIYALNIRRDANTTTPVTVPAYELPIMQSIFGKENVHNTDGKRIDQVGLGDPVGEYKLSEDEYARLCAKYGADRVEKVYGVQESGALKKAVAEAKKKRKKSGDNENDAGNNDGGTE